jgi:CubicO group peptidase (beta-lactamase class C family)
MRRITTCSLASVTLLLGPAIAAKAFQHLEPTSVRSQLPAFEKYVVQSQARTGVPGLAIAVVTGDEVVYLKGFGVRQVGKAGMVSGDTVFQLASLSKPVASTVVAGLVGRGAVCWDDRIAALIPGFQMSVPSTTARVSVRDMLSHRSGLPEFAGDVLVDVGFSRHELMVRTRFIPLEAPLGTHYAYSNVGYTIGAAAAARPTGIAWEDISRKILYTPLGMKSTSSRYTDYIAARDRAVPHVQVGGGRGSPACRMTTTPSHRREASARPRGTWRISCDFNSATASFEGRPSLRRRRWRRPELPRLYPTPATHPATTDSAGTWRLTQVGDCG